MSVVLKVSNQFLQNIVEIKADFNFHRNHNHIAENLLTVNEQGKYKHWESLDDEQKAWYVSAALGNMLKDHFLINAITGKTMIFSSSLEMSTLDSLRRWC